MMPRCFSIDGVDANGLSQDVQGKSERVRDSLETGLRTAARSDAIAKCSMQPTRAMSRMSLQWIAQALLFCRLNQLVDATLDRLPYLPCVQRQ
jgi:hypothetical protein